MKTLTPVILEGPDLHPFTAGREGNSASGRTGRKVVAKIQVRTSAASGLAPLPAASAAAL